MLRPGGGPVGGHGALCAPARIPGLLSGGSSAVVVAPGAAASGSGSPAASMGGDAAASAIARRCRLPRPSTLSNCDAVARGPAPHRPHRAALLAALALGHRLRTTQPLGGSCSSRKQRLFSAAQGRIG